MGVREALAGGPDWCASFSIERDENKWLQFTTDLINAAYPHQAVPADFQDLFAGREVIAFEAGLYVTIRMTFADVRTASNWIDAYFQQVLGCGEDYPLELELVELAT